MAVLDSQAQQKLGEIQSDIIEHVGEGTQTMGIPFHITLGSYATDELHAVIELIKKAVENIKPFDLRAVTSTDAMSADWARLPYEFLAQVSNEIINSVKGINRVSYDVSSKPPATIEWE